MASTKLDLEIQLSGFQDHLKKQGKTPKTIECYYLDSKLFLEWLQKNNTSCRQITPETLIAYQEDLALKDATENSIRRKAISIRQFFRYLCKTKVILDSPFDLIPIPERNDALPPQPDEDVVKIILQSFSKPKNRKESRDLAIMTLLGLEGIKASEIIEIKKKHFNQVAKMSTLRIPGPKPRTIRLNPKTDKALTSYISQSLENKSNQSEYLFQGFKGKECAITLPKLTRHGLKFALYEIGQQAGVEKLNAEKLRHHAIIHLLRSGTSMEAIMAHLGLKRPGNIAKHARKLEQSKTAKR